VQFCQCNIWGFYWAELNAGRSSREKGIRLFGVNRIYSFGDITILRYFRFALKLHSRPKFLFRFTCGVETIHKFVFVAVDLRIEHPTSKGVAFQISDVYS